MELFLALFGAIYWIAKIFNEKDRTERARRANAETQRLDKLKKETWLSRVTNDSLEAELEQGLREKREDLLQELRDTWRDYFDSWEFHDLLINDNARYRFFEVGLPSAYGELKIPDALRMLMANRGFLIREDADHGILMSLSGVSRKGTHLVVRKRFISEINSKLNSFGIKEKIYCGMSNNQYRPFDIMYTGLVKWEPMIPTLHLNISRRIYNDEY